MDLLGRAKQLKEVSATPTGANLHGSSGLLSMPGLGKRKKKKKVTAKHLQGQHDQASHGHGSASFGGSDVKKKLSADDVNRIVGKGGTYGAILQIPGRASVTFRKMPDGNISVSGRNNQTVTAEQIASVINEATGYKSLLERAKHLSESHNQATHAHSNTAELVTSLLRMPAKAREAAINALPPAHKKAVEDEMSKRHSMATTTKPGDKYRSLRNPAQYEALRKQGYSKSSAAAISNAGGGKKKKKEITNSFAVFKQKDGRYRWVSISSNAYRDRDGEIVSTKALQDDCERADREKDYGPLRFWHMPGVDIGDCDFNMVLSKSLVESGTFRSESIAQKVAEKAADQQISIAFRHPTDEPDSQGVFHNIRRFERSILPAGKASNPFTSMRVHKESKMNDAEKLKALKALLNNDDTEYNALIGNVSGSEKQADAMGIAFKEKKLNFQTVDELLTYAIQQKEAEIEAAKAKESEDDEEEEFDFKGYMKGCMTEMKNMVEGYTTEVKKLFGERDTKKEDTTASIKEATDAHSQRIATLETTIKQTQDALATAVKELTELKGNAPAGVANGVRPTQQADNVVATQKDANGQQQNAALKEWAQFAVGPYNQ